MNVVVNKIDRFIHRKSSLGKKFNGYETELIKLWADIDKEEPEKLKWKRGGSDMLVKTTMLLGLNQWKNDRRLVDDC